MRAETTENVAFKHFQRMELLTIHRLIYFLCQREETKEEPLQAVFNHFPFLMGAFNTLRSILPENISWESSFIFLQAVLKNWESKVNTFLPIRTFREYAGLNHLALQSMMLIGLAEDSQYFGTLFQKLQKPFASRRPTVQLISDILEAENEQPGQSFGSLLNSGLIEILNPSMPRAEWQLRIPPLIWDLLQGKQISQLPDGFFRHDSVNFPSLQNLVLLPEEKALLAKILSLLKSGQATALVLRGITGSERLEIAGSVARALGTNLLSAEGAFQANDDRWRLLGSIAALTQSLPLFSLDLAPGENFEIPRLISYRGPVIVVLGETGGLKGNYLERAISFTLSLPNPEQRYSHWQAALNGHVAEDLSLIAERFLLPGNYIKQTAALAINQAELENSPQIKVSHVRQAAQILNRQRLETLAQRLEGKIGWEHLIVNIKTLSLLKELFRRCRYREKLPLQLGAAFSGNFNRGVRALFNGPSGTGKSLAARILAAELGVDLYKIDLSAVVNKYIGETEKNLHHIFSRAEELDVVLLLDEGDSLLSNRTQVKSANDRYANLETNFLLQRLETYNGILLITSNLGENVDRAFQRRIDVNVEFHFPEAEERWQIWQLHLPECHQVSEEFLHEVAVRCKLSGGQIRNAVIYAACMALDEGLSIIHNRHIETTIENEYRKAGSVSPLKAAKNFQRHGQERLDNQISAMG